MFKKLSYILCASLLIVSTVGIILQEHHCLGDFEHASIELDQSTCCNLEHEMPPDCCEDEVHCFQLGTEFQPPTVLETISLQNHFDLLELQEAIPTYKLVTLIDPHQYYSPPLLVQDISILIQSFLI